MLGLIGKKIGMTQFFDEGGNLIPVTVVEVEQNTVVGERTVERNGYSSVILGATAMKKRRIKKPYSGQFPDGVEPCMNLKEIRNFEKDFKIGQKIGVELFEGLSFVDVQGVSKGKGYQGVMKRHGFSGGCKTHGSKFHRAGGSTGMAASPSKVLRGTKMAGRMGGEKRNVQNLQILKVDQERGILLIKGAIPGRRGGNVIVTKAKKK